MKLFFFLLLLTVSVRAQLVSIQKIPKEIDTQSKENRTVALFEAAYRASEQFAPEMGVKFEEFKTKLDKKFGVYFEHLKVQKLIQAYGKNYESTLDKESLEKFLKSIDSTKDVEFRKFTRLSDAIQSYSFKSNSEVELTLDKVKLDRIFKRIISDESKEFSKLLLLTEIDLTSFTWKDLGLVKDSSFIDALNESWEKWFSENLPDNVEEVEVCHSTCMTFINGWEQMSEEATITNVDNFYRNSVLSRVSFNLKKSQKDLFEWKGRIVLQDINTKKLLATYNLPLEKREIRNGDQKAINSALASSIYRSPLSFFSQYQKRLHERVHINRVSRLVIVGHRHLGDVLVLMEILKTRGSQLGLDVKLDFFRQNEAQLLCFYQGEEKSFSDLLSGVKELKSSQSYVLVNEFTGIHHILKLVTE